MKAVKASHIGLKRKNNEDNCGIFEDLNLLIVADGMGGHSAGEVASKMAMDQVEQYLRAHVEQLQYQPKQSIEQAILTANGQIYETAQEEISLQGMGTTITLAYFQPASMLIGHIGDSRAYLIRQGEISLVTSDHSLVNELLKNGGITSEEADTHPQRNVLTRALGTSLKLEVDFYEVQVLPGDIVLLCTDGLSNLVSPAEINECIAPDLDLVAERLIKRALERGGNDNISLVLALIE